MSDCLPRAILRAAEARALGGSWTAVAEAIGWDVEGLKAWIRDHQGQWSRELGRARREARDAACDEAVSMLRTQLRSKNDKTIYLAATALAKQFAVPKTKPQGNRPSDEALSFDDYLDRLSSSEREQFEERLQAAADEDD